MSGLFYNLGRKLGRAAVPAIRKGRWMWSGLTGSEEEAAKAEASLGAALAVEVRSATEPFGDPKSSALLEELRRRLNGVAEAEGRRFRCEVLRDDVPNAMALPGGYLFISHSLLELCGRREGELAFVLGHEMSHVLLGHAWDRMLDQGLLQAASLVVRRAGPLGMWVRRDGLDMLRSAHARAGELAADAMGLRLMTAAGFRKAEAVALLGRIEKLGTDPGVIGRYFATHPPAQERRAKLGQAG